MECLAPRDVRWFCWLPCLCKLLSLAAYVGWFRWARAFEDDPDEALLALRMLMLSLGLDYIDGPIARRLDMCTQFGDLLDHVADHVTMFWLVYITSSWQINVWANALHCAVALGYMAYYGCYFKHGGQPNWVAATIEANNYWNLASMLYCANCILLPLTKLSLAQAHGMKPFAATSPLIDLADMLGAAVTLSYSFAVWF